MKGNHTVNIIIIFFLLSHLYDKIVKITVPKTAYKMKKKKKDTPNSVPISHCETAYKHQEALASRGKEECFYWIQSAVNQWENTSHNLSSILAYHQLKLFFTGS